MKRWALAAYVLLGAAFAAGTASAGEGGGADVGDRILSRERYKYSYRARGRDIFTYRGVEEDEGELIDPTDLGDFGTGKNGTPDPEPGDGPSEGEVKAGQRYVISQAVKAYDESVKQFIHQRYDKAMQNCEEALQSLEAANVVAQDLTEKLDRLRKASEELKQRTDAERDFAKIDLAIQSIVYKERSPAAVINGMLVKEGQILLDSGLQIFKIRRGYVVFLYKNYRIRKQM